MQSTIIYFDPIGPRWQAGFRGPTEVSWVAKEPYGGWNRNVAALELSEQLYQALFFLNIVGRFEELPHEYMLTNLIRPAQGGRQCMLSRKGLIQGQAPIRFS